MNLSQEKQLLAYKKEQLQKAQNTHYSAIALEDLKLAAITWLIEQGIFAYSVYPSDSKTVHIYSQGRLEDAEFALLKKKLKKFPYQYVIGTL